MSRKQPEFSQPMRGNLRLRDDELFDDAGGGGESGGEGMLHMRDILPRLLARWHWILLCGLLGLGWGLYSVWRAVPLYQSRATVLVRDYNVTAMGQLDSAEFDLRNMQAIETVRAGMTRFQLFELVAGDPMVRELEGLEPPKKPLLPFFGVPEEPLEGDVPPVSQLAGMIASWVTVEVRPDTRLIDIVVKHPRAIVAQAIANRLVHHYIEDRTESRSSGQQTNLEFLIAESKRVKDELQQAQSVLTAYSAPLGAEKALAAAETAVGTYSLRYRAKHPKMIEAQARLGQAEEAFKQFMGRAVRNSSDRDYWEAHLARVGDLNAPGAIDEMRDLLVSRRAVLESEIESQNSLYRSLLGQIETREVNVQQTEAEVAPHEMARPGRHVYPQKPRMVIQGAALGLFAGLGLAFLFHILDNKLHTVADVEKQFNAPVLSAIAAIDPAGMKPKKGGKKGREPEEGAASVAARQNWDPLLVFHADGGKTHYAEMFRVLRTGISLLGPPEQRKITMVTSALPSEGKTFVAANLALALAQQGLNTLLVDFDLRKPSVHKMFGHSKDGQAGTVDLLTGRADLAAVMALESGQENLSLILSGPKAPNPGELLESGRLERTLEVFEQYYDHIVLDTAPLLAVPDSRILAPFADNLVLVARAELTPRGAVKRAVQILESSGISPSGIVLNGYVEKRFAMAHNYSYGYYRYGRYGLYHYEHDSAVYGEEEESS